MIVDTNVFIDFLKGEEAAKEFLLETSQLATSVIVVMEVVVGIPKQKDISKFENFLESAGIQVYPVTKIISDQAYQLLTEFSHSYGIGIPDVLIASTALTHMSGKVATLNVKHFQPLTGIETIIPYK